MSKRLLAVVSFITTLCACGPAERDELLQISSSVEAGWAPVQAIESAHPYANNSSSVWEVQGSADATELLVRFDRFELESGYDFVILTSGSGASTRHTGTNSGSEITVSGNRVTIQLQSDYSVTTWGFSIEVFERASASSPVDSGQWSRVDHSFESVHPYANGVNQVWTVTSPGASRMRVHFETIDVESGYDLVQVLDGADRVVRTYSGALSDALSDPVDGDTIKVQLLSDYSVTAWGLRVDYAERLDESSEAPPPPSAPSAPVELDALEDQLFTLVNQQRGLGASCGGEWFGPTGPLSPNPYLVQAARAHSADMASANYFSHTSADGRSPFQRMQDAGYAGSAMGENLAAGNEDPQATLQQWLDSPGHCRNLMSPDFTEMGIGYASNSGATYVHYWTQDLGRP